MKIMNMVLEEEEPTKRFTHYECGICDGIHPWTFDGDCRDNANRLTIEGLDKLPSYKLASWQERLSEEEAEF